MLLLQLPTTLLMDVLCFVANKPNSKARNIEVPKSSCLGHLLFLDCINDLPKVIENCSVAKYADDTSLYL